MDVIGRVIDYFHSLKGVVGVNLMDEFISNKIAEIEDGIVTQTGNDYHNIGYTEVMKRKYRVVIFTDSSMEHDKGCPMELVSSDGTVLGKMVMDDEIEEYRNRNDLVWISDDFVMYLNVAASGDESFVLYPFTYEEIHPLGCFDAVGCYPAPESDVRLKEKYNHPITDKIFTMIVGFNTE